MAVHILDLEDWFKLLASEKSEYHLPGTLLTLFRAVFPYESGMFANHTNDTIRATQWVGLNPSSLRRCFSKLNQDGFFQNGFHEIHEEEANNKFFYFLPMKNHGKLISLAGIESSKKIDKNSLNIMSVLGNQAAMNIEKNRLEEWASMTDCIIYILEPILASAGFKELIFNTQKGAQTLLGADNAALYFKDMENHVGFEVNSVESHLAKYVYDNQKNWNGTVGQYRSDFPENNIEPPEKLRSILAIPIQDTAGNYIGGVSVSYSFTDLPFEDLDKKLFEIYAGKLSRAIINRTQFIEMQEANKQLEELDKVKELASHQVTHDLKTPIGAIRGFSELMLTTEQDARSIKLFIENIYSASQNLLTMVEDLLDLARLKSTGDFQLKDFEPCSMGSLIEDLCKTASGISQKHEIKYEVSEGLPKINLDPKAISRVISNFVSNAIKYSPRGGNVTVNATQENIDNQNMIKVSISDEGLGIPEDKRAGLFDNFTRVDTTEHKKIDGTGLGLAICKEIVHAHKGQVWVDVGPNNIGSTFYFALPVEN